MLRAAPELQHKIMAELVGRKDLNIRLAQSFGHSLAQRALLGSLQPWLATRQGVLGYALNR